jgi:hypothetical protein
VLGRWPLLALAVALALPGFSLAQERTSGLSEAEVETLRDTAYYPPDRTLAFVNFLDHRTKAIDKLTTGKRQPGREDDLHDLIEQFTSIADDFQDNLDDYSQHHRDIRKVLSKVVAATERWGTALRSPPEHERYSVARKLALEALADLHETAVKLIDEQKAWFVAHPPAKDEDQRRKPGS